MSVASALYKETCYVCEIVAKWFKKTFINLQRARQLSVNREVARQFHELGYGTKGDWTPLVATVY